MKIATIIPARLGSERIPHKNICVIAGKPLIRWTIELAIELGYPVYVSTEADLIKQYISVFPVKVIDRPDHLATSEASVIDVLRHAQEMLQVDVMVMLYPTYLLRTLDLVLYAVNHLLHDVRIGSVVTILPVEDNPYWYVTMNEDGTITKLVPNEVYRHQDVPSIYKTAGAVHVIRTCELPTLDKNGMNENVHGIIIKHDALQCLEVDTPEAWRFADAQMRMRRKRVHIE